MLCSNIETGIGCICSSVPSLRHFLQRDASGSDSRGLSQRQAGGTWEELQDGSSDRSVALLHSQGIHKEQTFELDFELRDLEKNGNDGAPRHL
jgi:hypothetical protein